MKHVALFLHDIYFGKKSGRLVFKSGDIEKYFFFTDGDLLQVKTNQPEERLGEVLFRLEKISRDDHARMDDFIEPRTNIGEVLKSKGLISEADLEEALVYQLRETTLNTFPFFDADVAFQERTGAPAEKGVRRISVPFLIEYGIRRMSYDPALKAFLAKKVPRSHGRSMAHLLTGEEKKVLGVIQGGAPAEKVLADLGAAPDFFWKTLYLLYCLDLVDFEPEAASAPPAPEPDRAAAAGPEKAAEIADVMAMRDSLETKTYYQILDVPKTANEEEIKKAYFNLARRFHPDRFDRKVQAAHRDLIDEVFDAITNAYRTLINRDKRKAYDSSSGRGEEHEDAMGKADIKFRQGKTLYTQERFDDAVTLLEEAVRIRKTQGRLLSPPGDGRIQDPRLPEEGRGGFPQGDQPRALESRGIRRPGLSVQERGPADQGRPPVPEGRGSRSRPQAWPGRSSNCSTRGTSRKGLKRLLSMDLFGSKKK